MSGLCGRERGGGETLKYQKEAAFDEKHAEGMRGAMNRGAVCFNTFVSFPTFSVWFTECRDFDLREWPLFFLCVYVF